MFLIKIGYEKMLKNIDHDSILQMKRSKQMLIKHIIMLIQTNTKNGIQMSQEQ
jgi:hypothetical protein